MRFLVQFGEIDGPLDDQIPVTQPVLLTQVRLDVLVRGRLLQFKILKAKYS
jgi:hypothetical protein